MKNLKTGLVGTIVDSYRRWLPIVIAMAIYAFFAWRNRNFAIDDGMIYLRYINNFLQGKGLVYNPGTKFNGLTSPGFTLPLAAIAWITRDPKLSAWLVCSISGFFASLTWYFAFKATFLRLELPTWLRTSYAYTGLLLSLVLPFLFLTYGMETALFALISGLLLNAYLKERLTTAAFLAGALVAIRIEGGAFLLGMVVHQLTVRRKLPSRLPLLFVFFFIIPVLIFGFNLAYYGEPTAATGMAKLWQGQSGVWGKHSFLYPPNFLYSRVFGHSPFVLFGILTLALVGLAALWRNAIALIVVIYLVVYTAVFVLLNVPNYHWYYYPYFLVLPFLAVYGAAVLTSAAYQKLHCIFSVLIGLITIAPVCASAYQSVRYDLNPAQPDNTYINIGLWLRNNTPANSKIALAEIGFVGYYSDRYIIDTLGLVNPFNARDIGKRKFDGWLDHYRPDYILVHTPAWWPLEYGLYAAAARYGVSEVCQFDFPPYRLFKVDGEPGTGVTCDHEHWLPIGSDVPQAAGNPASNAIGHVAQVSVTGNVVRTDVSLDGQHAPLAQFVIRDHGAYGMATPVSMPIALAGNVTSPRQTTFMWHLVIFFPNAATARKWGRAPALSALDEHDTMYRFGPTVAQAEPHANLFSVRISNGQCALDAIDGKPSADAASVAADSAVTFGGWAGDGHGVAAGHGLLILRGKPQTYTIPFTTGANRPDVAKALDSKDMTYSGYNVTAPLTGVTAGVYSLFVAKPNNPATTCDLHRTLTVK